MGNCCGPRDADTGEIYAENSGKEIKFDMHSNEELIQTSKMQEQDLTILILGLDEAGKTSILKKFSKEESNDNGYTPTTGFQIRTLKYNNTNLNLKEVGGGDASRPYWTHYIDNSDGLIWVVDTSNRARI